MKKWHVQEIENTLEALQDIVGGYIETATLGDDAVAICNEEGRMLYRYRGGGRGGHR